MKKNVSIILTAIILFCIVGCIILLFFIAGHSYNNSATDDSSNESTPQQAFTGSVKNPYSAKLFGDLLYYTAPDASGTWNLYLRNLKTGKNKLLLKIKETLIIL